MRIKRNATKLRNIGKVHVPFINEKTEFKISDNTSKVNTKFYIDHQETMKMIADVTTEDIPWNLGDIEDGWEWFAFTFNDQKQISLSKEEIEKMITTSDSVVHTAYSKMNLVAQSQKWTQNTISEVDYIDKKIDLSSVDFVYDLGCGVGRHAIEFAKRGVEVMAIDYVEDNIKKGTYLAEKNKQKNVQFVEGDCRSYKSQRKASLVTCLYDVVGTFATIEDNKKIIMTAYDLLKMNGYAVFSVMNYETTQEHAKYKFMFSSQANKLLDLPASDIMEKSGNIFNPDYYMIDTETQIIYRKE